MGGINVKMLELEQSIKDLEEEIFKHDTPELRQKLLLLKAEFNDISTNKAAANITRLKQTYYDQGEKAGRLLAWRIKTQQNEGGINKIETIDGPRSQLKLIMLLENIMKIFINRHPRRIPIIIKHLWTRFRYSHCLRKTPEYWINQLK